jgi:hypothetical protein
MVTIRVPITPYILDSFTTLFRGRGDVYGSWAGGCVRKPLNSDTFLGHLQGDELIGVYPLLPYKSSWYTVWGCTDIDVDDLDSARNIQMAFTIKDIKSWVEKTRRGYHVWVFADSLIPAATMRRAFLAAHQAVNYPAKEVNPKQESAGTGYGNYVRLPYPNAIEGRYDERYILDDNDEPLPLQRFLPEALQQRATFEQLDGIAQLWKEPQRVHVIHQETSADVKSILRKAGAIPYVIWRDGPLEGADRSSTLFRLACKLRDAGCTAGESFAVLKSGDSRWGKFYLRSDGDQELIKIIERSYNIIWDGRNA